MEVPETCGVQFVPPLLVAIIVPLAPTAKQVVAETQATLLSRVEMPEVCGIQLVPPLAVIRIVPLLARLSIPTAKQMATEGQAMLLKS